MDVNKLSPIISVVMSVYNAENYLKDAIESILNQTFREFEFIIINDGSTDKSPDIISSFQDSRITLINNEHNIGLAASLNRGIEAAKGKYIARMDADDLSARNRLQEQYRYMELKSHCVAVGSNIRIIAKDGEYLDNQIVEDDDAILKATLPFNTPFAHGSAFIRKEYINLVHGYKEEMRYSQDVILWIDLMKYGTYGRIQKDLYHFRVVPFSNQNKSNKIFEIKKKILKEYYEHRKLNHELIRTIPNLGGGLSVNRRYYNYYMIVGYYFRDKQQNKKQALKSFITALRYWPMSLHTIYGIINTLFLRIKKT